MKMQTVHNASTITAHGYDPSTGTMHVTFKSGATHEYDDVPQEKYDEFTAADSLGSYLATNFRHWPDQRKLESS